MTFIAATISGILSVDSWPVGRGQNENRQSPSAEVLLVTQVLVRGNEEFETRFRSIEQSAVVEILPAHFIRRGDRVSDKCMA
jgi:hypothetical protein